MRFARAIYSATALTLLAGTISAAGAVAVPSNAVPAIARPALSKLTSFYTQKLTWTKCPENVKVKCAWVKVPLDYSKPSGSAIKLRIALHPASIQKHNLGDLFTNPGGPGGSGVDVALQATSYLPPAVTQRYNVVGIDPRGVGQSTPLHCLTRAGLDTLNGFGPNAINSTPTTATDIATFNSATASFGAACKAKNPTLFDHIGTLNAARDMDVVRGVLGQKKLTYYGWSYGTYLGAWYAELFPSKVSRFVLDGAIDPSLDNLTSAYDQLQAFEIALHRFLNDCANHTDCPPQLRGSPQANFATFQALSAQLATTPATSPTAQSMFGTQMLTQQLFLSSVLGMLYSDTWGWDTLRQALTTMLSAKHDPAYLLEIAYFEADKDPSTGAYSSNLSEAFNAISCYDYPPPPSVADASNDILATWSSDFPAFGSTFAWAQQICNQWPAHSATAPRQLHAKGSGPILVVGTKYDPATPYAEAVSLSKQLQHGRLLTWIGDGHTAYYRGSSCIDSSITTYLIKGTLPPVGKVCAAVKRP